MAACFSLSISLEIFPLAKIFAGKLQNLCGLIYFCARMRSIAIALLIAISGQAQTIKDCRERFNNYLNFKGKLNGVVTFESDAIYLHSGGKKQLAIYQDEIQAIGKLPAASFRL